MLNDIHILKAVQYALSVFNGNKVLQVELVCADNANAYLFVCLLLRIFQCGGYTKLVFPEVKIRGFNDMITAKIDYHAFHLNYLLNTNMEHCISFRMGNQ